MSPQIADDGQQGEDELSISIHSVQSTTSAMSSSSITSLQDIELAEPVPTKPEEAPKKDRKKAVNKIEVKLFENMKQARARFMSSNLHRMNPVVMSILLTDAAERFAYYGFRASLVLYFTQELKMDDTMGKCS